jgi:hypothetical protein
MPDPDYEVIRAIEEPKAKSEVWDAQRVMSAMLPLQKERMEELQRDGLTGLPFQVDQYLHL